MEAINEIFAAYGTYINIAIGAAVFILFTVFRNKLASLLLGITGKIILPNIRSAGRDIKTALCTPLPFILLCSAYFWAL